MLIPEVILYNTVSKFVTLIQEDFAANTNEACTLLYNMFYQDDCGERIIYETYDFYEQAKSMLLKGDEFVRKLQVYMGYNLEMASSPCIHILMPSDSKGRFDSIGRSESSPFTLGEEENPPEDYCEGKLFISREQTSRSVYHLMITSDNMGEVLVIYYFLKAMFMIMDTHFGLSGLLNMSNNGQDIQFQENLTPPHIFHRMFSIEFDYASKIKFSIPERIVAGLNFQICENLRLDNENYMNNAD